MSTLVCGIAASHTTLMNTRWDEVDHLPEAHAFRASLGAARQRIVDSRADVAIVIGPNHFRGFWLDLMPAFTIGVGRVLGAGEHGTPKGPLPVDPDLARAVHQGLFDASFDAAFSLELTVDHGITHAVQYVLPEGLPVVPLVINCLAPPLPPLARCAALGEALGAVIGTLDGDRRVAVVGSGGLSHRLPFPDWRRPRSDDDDFLVRSWIEGRRDWASFEERRRSIVVAAQPDIREEFDRTVLRAWEQGTMRDLLELESALGDLAGNGGHELRSWLTTAAACGWASGTSLGYAPIDAWLTGMAVGTIDQPVAGAAPSRPASV